jgi:hypothetical protein
VRITTECAAGAIAGLALSERTRRSHPAKDAAGSVKRLRNSGRRFDGGSRRGSRDRHGEAQWIGAAASMDEWTVQGRGLVRFAAPRASSFGAAVAVRARARTHVQGICSG